MFDIQDATTQMISAALIQAGEPLSSFNLSNANQYLLEFNLINDFFSAIRVSSNLFIIQNTN